MTNVMHLITTIDRGGAEKQLLTLAREQIKSKKITITPLKGSNELSEDFQELGCTIDNSLLNLHPLRQVYKLWKKNNSQSFIIHAHLPRAELIGALCKRRNKLVISKHVTETLLGPNSPKMISRICSLYVTSRASHFVAISNAVLVFIRKNDELCRRTPSSVIHYGYDIRASLAGKSLTDNKSKNFSNCESDLVLGTIARLVPQKDIVTLLRVFSALKEKFPKAILKILGRGYLEHELKLFAKSLGLQDGSVEWINHEPNVYEFLETIDVFIITSKYEGFGLVVLEAMQSNIPIVASRISPFEEILGSDFSTLCNVGEMNEFLDAVLYLASPTMRQEILNVQNMRLELFSPELMNEKMNTVYESISSN